MKQIVDSTEEEQYGYDFSRRQSYGNGNGSCCATGEGCGIDYGSGYGNFYGSGYGCGCGIFRYSQNLFSGAGHGIGCGSGEIHGTGYGFDDLNGGV
jgi:hypothetical protein